MDISISIITEVLFETALIYRTIQLNNNLDVVLILPTEKVIIKQSIVK